MGLFRQISACYLAHATQPVCRLVLPHGYAFQALPHSFSLYCVHHYLNCRLRTQLCLRYIALIVLNKHYFYCLKLSFGLWRACQDLYVGVCNWKTIPLEWEIYALYRCAYSSISPTFKKNGLLHAERRVVQQRLRRSRNRAYARAEARHSASAEYYDSSF